jgi:hypothetical protein
MKKPTTHLPSAEAITARSTARREYSLFFT